MAWCAVALVAQSRRAALRKATSVAYRVPLIGPAGTAILVRRLTTFASSAEPLPYFPLVHDAAMPSLGGVTTPPPPPSPTQPTLGEQIVTARALLPSQAGKVGCSYYSGDEACGWTGEALARWRTCRTLLPRVSCYDYSCVLIALYMRPHTAICMPLLLAGEALEDLQQHAKTCAHAPAACIMQGYPWKGVRKDLKAHVLGPKTEYRKWHGAQGEGAVLWEQPLIELLIALPALLGQHTSASVRQHTSASVC
jgi:hypothetical protein